MAAQSLAGSKHAASLTAHAPWQLFALHTRNTLAAQQLGAHGGCRRSAFGHVFGSQRATCSVCRWSVVSVGDNGVIAAADYMNQYYTYTTNYGGSWKKRCCARRRTTPGYDPSIHI